MRTRYVNVVKLDADIFVQVNLDDFQLVSLVFGQFMASLQGIQTNLEGRFQLLLYICIKMKEEDKRFIVWTVHVINKKINTQEPNILRKEL